MLYTRTINGVEISFVDRGFPTDLPAIVCLPGLGQDHRGYKYIAPYLLRKFRVIQVLWRGHGTNRDPVDKWTVEDQADDTIKLLDSLEVKRFIPLSHSHGGWCAMEMAARLGRGRVPAVLLTDLIQTPAPPEFVAALQAAQKKETWLQSQTGLIEGWLAGTKNKNVIEHFTNDIGAHGFQSWSHFCWLVEQNYKRWGSPMQRLEAISDPPLIRHVFSHPQVESYVDAHREFASKHSWFSFAKLHGETHFPVVELPESVALQLQDLCLEAVKREKA